MTTTEHSWKRYLSVMDEEVWTPMSDACVSPVLGCVVLSLMYVLSLYVWQDTHLRNEPTVIKKRFLSVFVTTLLSPFAIYIFSKKDFTTEWSLFELLGLRTPGLLAALVIPLLLTMVLFLGPISMQFHGECCKRSDESSGSWLLEIRDIFWLRDHIVAPLSEELTFRACMLPLLLQCYRPQAAVFICPLFFGLAHFHHVYGRTKSGSDLKTALLISAFQFLFTSLFGAYSAFLFLRTGHLVAPFLAHSFCNHMGFPNFQEVLSYPEPRRTVISILFLLGLLAWTALLLPLTSPHLYNNYIYWTT